jgi:hypothetical protein
MTMIRTYSRIPLILLTALLFCAGSQDATADICMQPDARGVMHFSNSPTSDPHQHCIPDLQPKQAKHPLPKLGTPRPYLYTANAGWRWDPKQQLWVPVRKQYERKPRPQSYRPEPADIGSVPDEKKIYDFPYDKKISSFPEKKIYDTGGNLIGLVQRCDVTLDTFLHSDGEILSSDKHVGASCFYDQDWQYRAVFDHMLAGGILFLRDGKEWAGRWPMVGDHGDDELIALLAHYLFPDAAKVMYEERYFSMLPQGLKPESKRITVPVPGAPQAGQHKKNKKR